MSLDEYPTEEELKTIIEWHYEKPYKELMDYVHELWKYAETEGSWIEGADGEGNKYYRLVTCGWSGNEDLIDALQSNLIFWILCWQKSERGGLYEFKVPHKV